VGYNNTITISTNSFSRGTDFQVLDEKIKEAGGLLVI
jgi:preprotein translocase subunit SecA